MKKTEAKISKPALLASLALSVTSIAIAITTFFLTQQRILQTEERAFELVHSVQVEMLKAREENQL